MKRIFALVMAVFMMVSFFAVSEADSAEGMYATALSMVGGDEEGNKAALALFEKVAGLGHAGAQTEAGRMYYAGIGAQQDLMKAYGFLHKSAMQGDAEGQYLLSLLLIEDHPLLGDWESSESWLRKAAGQDHTLAQVRLGRLLFEEYEPALPSVGEEAFGLFMRASEKGNLEAQAFVGICYNYGVGVKKNEKEAYKWIVSAAEQGQVNAIFELAYFYERGIVVKRDMDEAIRLYMLAAEQGFPAAQYTIGYFYYIGEAFKRNYVKAFEYFLKSAENGYPDGMLTVGWCYATGEGTILDGEKALEWFMYAAMYDVEGAAYNVGLCYLEGFGTEKDKKEAIAWLEYAAEQGDKDAIELLDELR